MLRPTWTLRFWILGVLSLCAADDPCQSLITLEPPEVVGELGDHLLVNCTTSVPSPEVVSWKYGNTASENGDDENFCSLVLPLSQWNVSARCTVRPNKTFECSKDLKVTVYNPPTLRLSDSHHVVDGHTYELKCYVMNVAPVQNLRVTWSSGNQTLHTQTFPESSLTPVNVSSSLNITAHKNLTGAAFRCEAELDLGLLEPELQPPKRSFATTLNVLYPPEIQNCPGELTALEHVHSLDTLPCFADANPAVTTQWYFGKARINGSEVLTRRRSGNYTAVFANSLGTVETSVKVKVEYAPELSGDVEELAVDEGTDVTLVCDADGMPLAFTWTCGGRDMRVSASVLSVSNITTNRSCTCRVQNHRGAASKIFHLRVVALEQPSEPDMAMSELDPGNCGSGGGASLCPRARLKSTRNCSHCELPDDVLISIPDVMLEGVDYQWTCHIINGPPAQNLKLRWHDGLQDVETRVFNQTATAPVNVSSSITFTAKREHDGRRFECVAEVDLGLYHTEPNPASLGFKQAVVYYGPASQFCPETFSGLENVVTLNTVPCKPDGNPAATLQWYQLEGVIDASKPLDRTRSGSYVAEAKNFMGTETFTVNITVEHQPSLSCQPSHEVAENDPLQTVCHPGGLPPPVVSWIKDGEELNGSHRWRKEDGGNYLVRATNKHGTAERQVYIDVLYAPRSGRGNSTVDVTPGGDAILECSADANPPPEIEWIFRPAANVAMTTGWRQSVLTVGGATSSNAGVYTCVAANKVGSVTTFHTLRMKDQSSTFLPVVFWALLILLVVLMIVGVVVCFATCKTKRRHRRYSFVPSTSRNDSERSYPLNEWMKI